MDRMTEDEYPSAILNRLQVLEKENEALRRKLHRYEKMELRFRKLVETMSEGLIVMDGDERITYVNKHLEEVSGYRANELAGRKIHEFLSPETSQLIYRKLSGEDEHPRRSFEIAWQRKSGETQYSIVSAHVLDNAQNGMEGSFAILTNITAKKQAEQALRRRERELKSKNARLEEMNLALQTLVKMREKDKAEIESALSANLQRLVEPLIEKLRNSGLTDRQKMVVTMLSANLAEMSSSQNRGLAARFTVLTPAEMEVANFVRHGRTTKEIAALMNISARTVDMHRLNIRRKLGLHRKGTNLRSYLLSS
jgi:PAS domain S-box-containing protein